MIAASLAAASSPATAFDHKKLAETARSAFIVPRYARLNVAVTSLGDRIRTLCSSPAPAALHSARQAFRATVQAWGEIELITFGPVAAFSRYERILFWPDRKGIGRRQVARLLRKRDETATDPVRLADKSVAVQGLAALELLLHGKASAQLVDGERLGFACRYAHAITRNLTTIITNVRRDWNDEGAFTKIWLQPGEDNPAYLDARETTFELMKAIGQSLELLRDRRIAPAIGMGPTRRKKRPILWRSKLSATIFRANIAAVRDLLKTGGLGEAYLAHYKHSDEAVSNIASLGTDFNLTLDAVDQLVQDPDPFARKDIKRRLIAVGFPLKSLRTRATALISQAAGLSIGFNAADGD